jgi:hypothetical protein
MEPRSPLLRSPKRCTFTPSGEVDSRGWKRHRCERCQYRTTWIIDRGQPIYRVCGRQGEGLGDFVARCLSVVGITKPRMEAIAGGNCGCTERQERLNQVGWELSDQWAKLLQIPLSALRRTPPAPASGDTPQGQGPAG